MQNLSSTDGLNSCFSADILTVIILHFPLLFLIYEQSRLRRQDVGLKSHLDQLDQRISELKLDVSKTSSEYLDSDSRPSSGNVHLVIYSQGCGMGRTEDVNCWAELFLFWSEMVPRGWGGEQWCRIQCTHRGDRKFPGKCIYLENAVWLNSIFLIEIFVFFFLNDILAMNRRRRKIQIYLFITLFSGEWQSGWSTW